MVGKRFGISILLLCLVVARARAETEEPAKPRLHWIALETLGLFGIGEAWYWRHGASTNSGDWELPRNWSAITTKFSGDGFRYDGDGFITNGLKHPLFGLASYEIARENGYGMLGSFVFASLTSGIWETFGEWQEYGSINDLMLTSTSGVPLGEALHQMLHHVRQTRLDAVLGFGSHREGTTAHSFETVALRTALDTPARSVAFDVEIPFDGDGTRGVLIDANTSIKSFRNEHGVAALISTFDYRDKSERPGEDWDVHAMVGLGTRAGFQIRAGDATFELGVVGTAETGMEKAHAFQMWRAVNPDAFVRGSEQTNKHGYYHAIGGNASSQLAVSYGGVSAGVYGGAAMYRALEGHDRYRDKITADPELADRELTAGGWFSISHGRALLRLDLWQRQLTGRADEFRSDVEERDVLVSAGVRI